MVSISFCCEAMIERAILLAVTALASAAPLRAQAPAEPVTLIHAGTLIAEPGKTPLRNASVIVRGGKIYAGGA